MDIAATLPQDSNLPHNKFWLRTDNSSIIVLFCDNVLKLGLSLATFTMFFIIEVVYKGMYGSKSLEICISHRINEEILFFRMLKNVCDANMFL